MDADQVKLTHTDKIFWPDEGYTKGDLIAYYRQVSPWLLPYLRDRPLVLTRFPDGITGKSFFQKDAPGFTPDWIRTERMWSDQAGREIDYFVCDDEATLVYLINLGTIPLHIWSSRVAELARPDWCILDLDPKTAPFSHVVRVARAIHALLDEIGLPGFIKTSGQAGLHILVPLGGQCTYEHSKSLGELIARIIADDLSDIATVARSLADRSGRVYVDFLQNGHGKTIASPFSARPIAGGRVSMPLTWSEVGPRLDPARFTLKTAMRRLARWSADPMAGVLSERPDLTEALGILGQRMGKTKRKK